MTGRLDLSPWARQVIPEADRAAIRQRVPAGYVLWVAARHGRLQVRLVAPGRDGCISTVEGPYPWAVERALEALDVDDWHLAPDLSVTVPLVNRGEG